MTSLINRIKQSILSSLSKLRLVMTETTRGLLLLIKQKRRLIIKKLLFFPGIPFLFLFLVPTIQEATIKPHKTPETISDSDLSQKIEKQKTSLREENKRLGLRLTALTGNQPYLIINTSKNTFYLFVRRTLVAEGICSTGSYVLLRNGDKEQWLFETPKGQFRIQSKTTSPVWKKPDWAFIEEGLPVPQKDDNSRFEYGVLGDYALGLGDGYLIHGTLFQRFLGLPVTHGCVRMNDADLKLVYNTLALGSRVYIY